MTKRQITVPFFIPHMGCPHRCAFCAQWHTTGAAKVLQPGDIALKVHTWRRDISPSVTRIEAAFFGGSFTGLPLHLQKQYLDAAHSLKKDNSIHAIRLSTRPDYISDEILDLLQECSVDTVELGAQSFNDAVLEQSRRGHSALDIINAADKIRQRNIDLVIQLMPGLPGDTREISLESAESAADLSPAAVRLYPTVVLEGTELEGMMKEGRFTPLTLEEAVEWGADQFALFEKNSIPVIRMGLHPLAPEQETTVTAGPYHPSLGFLIKSRHRRRILEMEISNFLKNHHASRLAAGVPSREIPEYIGEKRENVLFLENRFNLSSLKIIGGDSPQPEVMAE